MKTERVKLSFKSWRREKYKKKIVKKDRAKTMYIPDFPKKSSAIKRPRDKIITERINFCLLFISFPDNNVLIFFLCPLPPGIPLKFTIKITEDLYKLLKRRLIPQAYL